MKKTSVRGKKLKRLPGTRQRLQAVISGGRLYADKTPYIHSMVKNRGRRCLFLSGPGRFGKTLLLDTLNELFSGRRHLFENPWIGRETGYDFRPHPVIRLFMNYAVTGSPEQLENHII
ncbi:MAG: AAA family ATPase [Deltaproteobacteria bacterium]|jgi:hypothetical protein|nr:AAA family ATPase [Deltaproteobacteria bacterium]